MISAEENKKLIVKADQLQGFVTNLAQVVLKKKELSRFRVGNDFDLVISRTMQIIKKHNAIADIFSERA